MALQATVLSLSTMTQDYDARRGPHMSSGGGPPPYIQTGNTKKYAHPSFHNQQPNGSRHPHEFAHQGSMSLPQEESRYPPVASDRYQSHHRQPPPTHYSSGGMEYHRSPPPPSHHYGRGQHPNFAHSRDGAFAPYHRPVARKAVPGQVMMEPNDGSTSAKDVAEKRTEAASEEAEESRDDNAKEEVAVTSSQDREDPTADNLNKRPLDVAVGSEEATISTAHDDPTPRHYNSNKNKRTKISERGPVSQMRSVPESSSDSFEARQDKSQGNLGEYESRHSSSASITQGLSWTEYPEPAGLQSKSMSWEVPAGTLSTIGSFGQFNMGTTSPQKKMRDSVVTQGFAPLPPLPTMDQDGNLKQNQLAQRTVDTMFDPPRPTSGVNPRTTSAPYPDPLQSNSLFPFPNEQANAHPAGSFDDGLYANRSFQSLDDLDGPENALMYGKSFSWERGLDMDAGNGPASNYDCDDSKHFQLKEQQSVMRSLVMKGAIRTIGNPHNSAGMILLLSMPDDRHCLSETLAIIRNNVEVFTATEADINAPAPGRKRPIQLGQVGLRCVYCRMCRQGSRVKRATCFPSSMKRIYRAVIDMKLDHFKHCPYVPQGLKERLDQLSQGTTRSTGMTVQYFIRSAIELGMKDVGTDGVFINLKRVGKALDDSEVNKYGKPKKGKKASGKPRSSKARTANFNKHVPLTTERRYHGKVLLALPEDENFLSPLRCFLREQVCVFSATETDISIRTPTTSTVEIGQVGVGCAHCLKVAPKDRSNRAVCFPFSIGRIYQSVADIQRFHLGECRMMPPEARSRFLQLQSESAKGSRGLATRTYWNDAAKKIGLKDGNSGMFFARDPALPPPIEEKPIDVLAQVASNFNVAKYPLVGLEDKPTIAQFLYRVMEQLQPCRFTDADRNKRRSKNLGTIGVECKHCAGKIDGRKFFWSSVSAAESNFVSVHSHMMECNYIGDDLKTELAHLKTLRREQTSLLKNGSQKAFFTRVWERLQEISDKLTAEENMAIEAAANELGGNHENELRELQACGSEEIRALLESKSTLSSMPSIEHCDSILKSAFQQVEQDIDLTESAGDSIIGGASKSSLSSVARNLSTVTMHCQDEAKIAAV